MSRMKEACPPNDQFYDLLQPSLLFPTSFFSVLDILWQKNKIVQKLVQIGFNHLSWILLWCFYTVTRFPTAIELSMPNRIINFLPNLVKEKVFYILFSKQFSQFLSSESIFNIKSNIEK